MSNANPPKITTSQKKLLVLFLLIFVLLLCVGIRMNPISDNLNTLATDIILYLFGMLCFVFPGFLVFRWRYKEPVVLSDMGIFYDKLLGISFMIMGACDMLGFI